MNLDFLGVILALLGLIFGVTPLHPVETGNLSVELIDYGEPNLGKFKISIYSSPDGNLLYDGYTDIGGKKLYSGLKIGDYFVKVSDPAKKYKDVQSSVYTVSTDSTTFHGITLERIE
ncbi:MAG: hypothetical protein Q7K42_03740 [Candidatus Diapherotrites archaeon]|nr:hypothetical protein [Candidatus Diapherotrites archaeon]